MSNQESLNSEKEDFININETDNSIHFNAGILTTTNKWQKLPLRLLFLSLSAQKVVLQTTQLKHL